MRLSASSSLLLATLAVSAAVVSPHRYHPREVLALANDNKGEHHQPHLAGSTSIASRDLLAERESFPILLLLLLLLLFIS